jgi:hypothetical protein
MDMRGSPGVHLAHPSNALLAAAVLSDRVLSSSFEPVVAFIIEVTHRDPSMGHLVSRAATARNPNIRIRVIDVVFRVVIPRGENHDRARGHQRRHILFVYVAQMPVRIPIGDHTHHLPLACFRVENLQGLRDQPQVPVRLEAVDTDRVIPRMESLCHRSPVGSDIEVTL